MPRSNPAPGVDPSTAAPTCERWSYRNRSPDSSVSARCEAQETGKSPRSARKITNSNPNRRPSAASRWPVSYHHSVSRSWGPSSAGNVTGCGSAGTTAVGDGVSCRSRRWDVGEDGAGRRAPDEDQHRDQDQCPGLDQRRALDDRQPRADPAPQSRGHPPVPVAEQTHRGWHEERPDDRRVEGDRDGHAEAHRLDEHDLGERERAGDQDHDQGRAGHDAPAPLQTAGHRLAVVAGPVVDLLHAAEQEDLVVHGQPEEDTEQDHRQRRLHESQRLEAERRREVAVLEDPDQGAEAGQDREPVHDERLGRQHHRAQQHEEHEIGRDEDEQGRPREVGADPVHHVLDLRRATAHRDGDPGRRRER